VEGIRVFDGAVAIVTGGASGIGRALAEALAKRGAEVVVADLQAEVGTEVAAALRALGHRATAAPLDVTDPEAVRALVEATAARCGRLDYLFNNAGIGVAGEICDLQLADWERIIAVNLRGVVHGVQAAYPLMRRQGFGHIVNTASMQGLLPGPFFASYAATKAAVVSLSRALRAEAAPAGIRVSVLCPGVIRTPLLRGGRFGIYRLPLLDGREPDRETLAEVSAALFARLWPMDPARFARAVLRQLARNRAIVIVPAWWRALWWLERASPALSLLFARRLFTATQREMRARLDAAGHGARR
jgi:NAD(P)-dependent dehydrogenase (short-subunit alcohol dehydrogenase family)